MIRYCLWQLLALGPDREEFDDLVRRAEAAFRDKQWDVASRAFADAYALEPRPTFLYARAQAERLSGRCNVAVPLYDAFIEVAPSAQAAEEARINRGRCPSPTAATTGATVDDGATEPPRVPADRSRSTKWSRDPAGGVLVATGAVSVVIGASVLGFAVGRDRRAGNADTEGAYVEEKDAARRPHRAGIVVLSVGAALLGAGVVRWAVVASRSRGATRASRGRLDALALGLAPARRGAALSLGLRF